MDKIFEIGHEYSNSLSASWIETPLGRMLGAGNEEVLYFLDFADQSKWKQKIQKLSEKTKSKIIPGTTQPLESIKQELSEYFDGKLSQFKTPLFTWGSPFQKQVWEELRKIPVGETCAYSAIATAIGKPRAYRAVAQANGANRLAIIIPCHRVINASGCLGGYASGITRKKWLIDHEKQHFLVK